MQCTTSFTSSRNAYTRSGGAATSNSFSICIATSSNILSLCWSQKWVEGCVGRIADGGHLTPGWRDGRAACSPTRTSLVDVEELHEAQSLGVDQRQDARGRGRSAASPGALSA